MSPKTKPLLKRGPLLGRAGMWTHTSFPELAVKRNKTGDWVLTMAATGRARKKAPPASDHAKDMLRDLGSRAFPTLRNAVRALEAHDAVRDSG